MFWFSIKEYLGWFVLVFAVLGLFYWGSQSSNVSTLSIAVGKDSEINLQAADAVKRHIETHGNVTVTLIPTNGSQDSRKLLVQGDADLAIILPQLLPDMRGIKALTPVADHYLHWLMRDGQSLGSVSQLQQAHLAIGSLEQDSHAYTKDLLNRWGLAPEKLRLSQKSAQALLMDPSLDGAVVLGGPGDFMVKQAVAKGAAQLVGVPSLEETLFTDPLLTKGELPGGLYGNAEQPAYTTLHMVSMLVGHDSTPQDILETVSGALRVPETNYMLAPFLKQANQIDSIASWQIVPKALVADSSAKVLWGMLSLKQVWILSGVLALLAGVYLWQRNIQVHKLAQIQTQQKQIVHWLQQLRSLEEEVVNDRDPSHIQHFLEQLQMLKGKVEKALLEYEESNRSLLMTVLNESNALTSRLHMAKLSFDHS